MTSLRGFVSPPPAHTERSLPASIAIAPTDAKPIVSETFCHDAPPSVVFQTPPPAVPA